jgi:anti-anti-sigma factor
VDVISVKGPLNAEVIAGAREFVEPRLAKGIPKIVMDFEGTQLIDSAGLEFRLELQERCFQTSGDLQLAAVGGLCRDAFSITGVGERFEMFADVPSAVGSFSR